MTARASTTQIKVPLTPTNAAHAASKQYVDGITKTVAIPVWFEIHATYAIRAVGYGDNQMGLTVPAAFTLTEIVYRGISADASGSTTGEVRRNGTAITGSSLSVAAANQWTYGSNVRITGLSQAISAGDVLRPYISAIGTTPGAGFSAVLVGTVNATAS